VRPAGNFLHFEGTFRGIYRGGKVAASPGTYTFKSIDWLWLEVTPVTKLEHRLVDEERVSNFFYASELPKPRGWRLPGQRSTEVILVGPERKAFAGTIYDAVMWVNTPDQDQPEIVIKESSGKPIAQDAFEISGTIRFSIPETLTAAAPTLAAPTVFPLDTAATTTAPSFTFNDSGTAAAQPSITPPPPPTLQTGTGKKASGCAGNIGGVLLALLLMKWMPIVGIIALLGILLNAIQLPKNAPSTVTGNEKMGCLSIVLVLIACGTCAHAFLHAPRVTFYALLFITLIFLTTRVNTRAVWKVLFGIITLLTLIGYWSVNTHFDWKRFLHPPKTEGRVRSEPPVPIEVTDRNGNKQPDSLYRHTAEWDDFMNRSYEETYSTTLGQFTQSSRMHQSLAGVDPRGDVQTYWTSIYQALVTNDAAKLDSLAHYFADQRDSLSLNPTETAEAVVTFIQEIPYYLVHNGTCEEAANAGNEFMAEYHAEGKPCLANMAAGIQGPYEFIHNLKGDCDTRSVLCYTLLSKLGIPCSVWVSEVYGHSIIGIGTPASGNNYKTVGGQRHFATELTAKGFRLGMISPDHTDMDNWIITLKTS
jgi:hypothetical protein